MKSFKTYACAIIALLSINAAHASFFPAVGRSITNAVDRIFVPSDATLMNRAIGAQVVINKHIDVIEKTFGEELQAIRNDAPVATIVRSKVGHSREPFALYAYACKLNNATRELAQDWTEIAYHEQKIKSQQVKQSTTHSNILQTTLIDLNTVSVKVSELLGNINALHALVIGLPEYASSYDAYYLEKERLERYAYVNEQHEQRLAPKTEKKAETPAESSKPAVSIPVCDDVAPYGTATVPTVDRGLNNFYL